MRISITSATARPPPRPTRRGRATGRRLLRSPGTTARRIPRIGTISGPTISRPDHRRRGVPHDPGRHDDCRQHEQQPVAAQLAAGRRTVEEQLLAHASDVLVRHQWHRWPSRSGRLVPGERRRGGNSTQLRQRLVVKRSRTAFLVTLPIAFRGRSSTTRSLWAPCTEPVAPGGRHGARRGPVGHPAHGRRSGTDALTPLRIGDTHHGTVRPGGRPEHLLDLECRDLLAARLEDVDRDTSQDAVAPSSTTATSPVRNQPSGKASRGVGTAPVFRNSWGPSHLDLARLARGDRRPIVIDQPYLDAPAAARRRGPGRRSPWSGFDRPMPISVMP